MATYERRDYTRRTIDFAVPVNDLWGAAAEHGSVRPPPWVLCVGQMAGRDGDTKVPPDANIVFEVIDACDSVPDLYPVVATRTYPRKRIPR